MNEDCCGKLSQCSSHGNSVESIDIENLDQLACVDSPTHRPESEIDAWLAISAEGMSSTCDFTLKINGNKQNLRTMASFTCKLHLV